ncbi:MAG: hypothetical protein ACRBN8_37975 [Nannocystales bacterium]
MPNKSTKNALVIGGLFALIETLLVYGVDPDGEGWVLLQGATFWFSCGVLVALSKTDLHPFVNSMFVVVLMNVPWYIALAVVPHQLELLPPLVLASVVLGGVGGGVKTWLDRDRRKA